MKLTFHTDPSHGWLEVPRSELAKYGLLERVSSCSYESLDGSIIYLEEDCDAGLYLNALKENGVDFTFDERYQKSTFIRNLPSYSVQGW